MMQQLRLRLRPIAASQPQIVADFCTLFEPLATLIVETTSTTPTLATTAASMRASSTETTTKNINHHNASTIAASHSLSNNNCKTVAATIVPTAAELAPKMLSTQTSAHPAIPIAL